MSHAQPYTYYVGQTTSHPQAGNVSLEIKMEQGTADEVFDNPKNVYTQALMKAALQNEADDSGAVMT